MALSTDHGDTLRTQLARYRGECAVHVETTALAATSCLKTIIASGGQVALFVIDSTVADVPLEDAIAKMRSVVPTARRLVITPWTQLLRAHVGAAA